MTWVNQHIAIGAFDEAPPAGAFVLDLRGIPDHTWISEEDFLRAMDAIRNALPGKVFVHCIGGISRSPTIVAAHLALTYDINAHQAVARIQAMRPEIKIHPKQMESLCRFVEDYRT